MGGVGCNSGFEGFAESKCMLAGSVFHSLGEKVESTGIMCIFKQFFFVFSITNF